MTKNTILKLEKITKEFSGVEVLHGIDFAAFRGEVHALVGENGAGKSTLMKILGGVYPFGQYDGGMTINGKSVRFSGTEDAKCAGIEIIAQELELVPQLPVYENVYLGKPIRKNALIDCVSMIHNTNAIFKKLGMEIAAEAIVETLGVGQRQMVAIARALLTDANIIIFDEPTAALSDAEAMKLFSAIKELKQKGITVIYISHRLKEILEISDRVTVLRDGMAILTAETKELDESQLVSYMIGRKLTEQFPARNNTIGPEIFRVKNFSAYSDNGKEIIKNINFSVRCGEILGISGLVGAGRSELVQAIFGVIKKTGQILLDGNEIRIACPSDAISAGVALVSEDRKADGFVPMLSLADNITMADLQELSHNGIIDDTKSITAAEMYRKKLKIKTNSINDPVERLSGGNQQKVCIAKFLLTSPKLLILDEPTRGVDVGAKHEIYTLINQLVEQGMAVIMVSSELPEIFGMSDRIMVMSAGRQRTILEKKEADQETVMKYATVEGD